MKKIYLIAVILIVLISTINGDVGFSDENFAFGHLTAAFGFADIDGDSDNDMLTVSNGDLYWVENIDAFATTDLIHPIGPGINFANKIITRDIESDGDIDVLAFCSTDNEFKIYKNTGDGTFDNPISITTNSNEVREMVVEDFDLDGLSEYLIFNDHSISVYQIDLSTGSYVSDSLHWSYVYNVLKVEDIDADGYKDVIFYDSNHTYRVIKYNSSSGLFNSPVALNFVPETPNGYNIEFCELNNDNIPELIAYDYSTETINCYVYNQNLGYVLSENLQIPLSGCSIEGVCDFNCDGSEELIVANNSTLEVYEFGNNYANLITHFEYLDFSHNMFVAQNVFFTDVNNDGNKDIVFRDGLITYFENNSFSDLDAIYLNLFYAQLKMFDLNSDGIDDIDYIMGNYHVPLISDGNGSLNPTDIETGAHFYIKYEIGSFDDNPDPDYVVAYQQSNLVVAMNSLYDTTYVLDTNVDILGGDFLLRDVDGDTDLDIIGITNTNTIYCYENVNGVFSDSNKYLVVNAYPVVGVFDLNNDGLFDIIQNDSGTIRFRENQGDFNFDLGGSNLYGYITIDGQNGCSKVEGTDLNGDGFTDLILHGLENNTVNYLINSDDGLFSNSNSVVLDELYSSYGKVLIEDLDGDSDAEIIFLRNNYNTGSYEVVVSDYNSANNRMEEVYSINISGYSYLLGMADFNGDGLRDIVINYAWSSDGISVILNESMITPNGDNEISFTSAKLLSNYPNPFNPETKINYSLAKAGNAKLTIYNIKGQRIKTLVNDHVEAGEHSIIWNGKNEKGSDVASGVYLYRLNTADGVQNKKMLLLK